MSAIKTVEFELRRQGDYENAQLMASILNLAAGLTTEDSHIEVYEKALAEIQYWLNNYDGAPYEANTEPNPVSEVTPR